MSYCFSLNQPCFSHYEGEAIEVLDKVSNLLKIIGRAEPEFQQQSDFKGVLF